MALSDTFGIKGSINKSQRTRSSQTYNHHLDHFVNTNPQPPQPTQPIKEQAKEKLTTSKYFRAIYSKDGFTKFNNLSINDMKYIFDNNAINYYLSYGIEDIKNSHDYEAYRMIKNSIPRKLIGGGEDESMIPFDKVDLKNTYNSEAKALAVA